MSAEKTSQTLVFFFFLSYLFGWLDSQGSNQFLPISNIVWPSMKNESLLGLVT